jgi:hypothetical protein
MASKRQPSKQRRQSQNQKQRAALEARRQAAAASPAPSGAGTEPSSPAASPAPSGGGSVLSRLRAAPSAGRAARPRASGQAVGHRAALSALLAAVAALAIVWFANPVPLDRSGEPIATTGTLVGEWSLSAQEAIADAPDDATTAEIAESVDDWLPGGTQRYLIAAWPTSLLVVLPVVGTALGFRAVTRRSPAKVVNRTMYVTLFGALLAGPALILFLPAVISLGVAAYQVRKAEVAAQAAEPDEPGDGTTDPDEVIDVDEVDAVDDDAVEPDGAAERS